MAVGGNIIGQLKYVLGIDNAPLKRGLAETQSEVEGTVRGIDAMHATVQLRADKSQFDREFKEVMAEIEEVRASNPEVSADLDSSQFDAGYRRLLAKAAALDRKRITIQARINYDRNQLATLGRDVEKVDNLFARMTKSITRARVNIGPFTLTLKNLLLVAAPLAPVLFDLAGAATALAGSLSLALGGALSVGAAGMAGFSLATAGAVFAIHPLITEMGTASTASKALTTAQLKYGKASTQAQTAQDQFNHTLSSMSPALRAVMRGWQQLQSGFQARTGGIRQSFIGDMADSIKTARALMPQFARDATSAFRAASGGWEDWMSGLRSAEAKNILGNIMGNFTDALPSLMHGLGQFITALARITSAGSDFLGQFTRGFDRVGSDFADSTSNAQRLHQTMSGLVSQTHSWFDLLGATGHLLVTLFTGGARSGQRMVDDLTHSLREWNRQLSTPEGRDAMAHFFDQAVTNSERFFGVLRRVLTIFFDLSRALEPISSGFLDVANFLGDIGHEVTKVAALRVAFEGIGIALAGLWVGNKARLFVDWIAGAASRLGILTAAESAETAALSANTVALEANTVARVESAAALGSTAAVAPRAAAGLSAVEGAAAGATGTTTGLGAALLSLPVLGAASVFGGVVALGYAFRDTSHWTERLSESIGDLKRRGLGRDTGLLDANLIVKESEALRHAAGATDRLVQAHRRSADAARRAKDDEQQLAQTLRTQGRFSMAASQQGLQALRTRLQAANQEAQVNARLRGVTRQYTTVVRDARSALRSYVQGQQQGTLANVLGMHSLKRLTGSTHEQLDADKRLQAYEHNLTVAQNDRAASLFNVQRQFRGLQQVVPAAKQQVGEFIRTFKAFPSVKKFLLRTNSREAVQGLSKVGNEVSKLGGRKAVVRILGNSKNADQAFTQLNRKLAQLTLKRFLVRLDAQNEGAETKIDHTQRSLDTLTHGKHEAKIEADDAPATTAARKVHTTLLGSVRGPFQATINARDNASGPARAAKAAIDAIHDKSVTITTFLRTIQRKGFAEGGPMVGAFANGGQPARSMKVTKPTYLTGEEAPRHPEWVIATNPAYRNQNVLYLDAAAADLGYALIPAYAGGGRAGKGSGPSPKPRGSKYDQLHRQIDYWAGRYDADRREYDQDLAAGRGVGAGLPGLIADKEHSISLEHDLRRTVLHMLKHQKKQMARDKHKEHALKRQISHTKNAGKKSRLQSQLSNVRSQRQQLRQGYPDLYDEWKHQIPLDIRNLNLDIQDLKDQKSGAAAEAELQQTALGQERYALLRDFGSNFMGNLATGTASRFGTLSALAGGGPVVNPTPAPAPTPTSAPATEPSRTTIINNAYLRQPEDPHTWSKSMAYEAAVANS